MAKEILLLAAESEEKGSEEKDDAYVGGKSLPRPCPAPEEQNVDANDDNNHGYHQRDNDRSIMHRSVPSIGVVTH
jgi:hypothetical protein